MLSAANDNKFGFTYTASSQIASRTISTPWL